MGVLAELLLLKGIGTQPLRLSLKTGLLGGFTTFSAFSLDAAVMWQRRDYTLLISYALGSVLFSLSALFFGMAATKALV